MSVPDPQPEAWTVPFARSLSAQLIVLVLVATIPLVLLISLNIDGQVESYRRDALSEARFRAQLIRSRLDDHFNNMDSLLHTLAVTLATDLNAIAANDAKLRAIRDGRAALFLQHLRERAGRASFELAERATAPACQDQRKGTKVFP